MARHKDQEWILPEGVLQSDGSRTHVWESIHASLLMDLRDELKRLNALLSCANFTTIPETLRAIKRNTTKRKRNGTR